MMDLNDIALVDAHCHPFLEHHNLSVEQFVSLAAFPGGGADFLEAAGIPGGEAASEVHRLRRSTVFLHFLVNQLGQFLGCDPVLEQVVSARNLRCQEDFPGYTRQLFAACGLAAMITDFGYPKPLLDAARFQAVSPIPVIPIYRIETFIDAHLAQDVSWEELNRKYEITLSAALQHGGFKGLKSIIAYRTGLEISPLSRAPDYGRLAWEAIRRGVGSHKPLRDHFLCRAIEMCIEHNMPMQIHTGIGDYEINLGLCRPALLLDLLRFPVYRACRVLLVHGGYPYHAEAGFLANILPRVYCDVSEGIPFGAQAAYRIYREVLEMAPFSKVLYGSDGYVIPELSWAGALLGKRALAHVLGELVESRMLTLADAWTTGRQILGENALHLYGQESS